MNQTSEKFIEILETIKEKINNLKDKLSEFEKASFQSQLDHIIEYINDQENIANIIGNLTKELNRTKSNYELNLIFSIVPKVFKVRRFKTDNDMKNFLKNNIPTDSQERLIFDRELMEGNGYFIHQCNNKYEGGSIIIDNRGFLIYGLHFNPYRRELFNERSELVYHLQLYEIVDYFLGFLKFMELFYRKIDYTNKIQISLTIDGLSKWQYFYGEPPEPQKHVRELSRDSMGTYNVRNILENKKVILEDIIGPMLNCYNHPREEIIIYYHKIQNSIL